MMFNGFGFGGRFNDAQNLAYGMMYMDALRLQNQQMRYMYDYEYLYRRKPSQKHFKIPNKFDGTYKGAEDSLWGETLYSNKTFKILDIPEFPIESFDVLSGKTQAILSLVKTNKDTDNYKNQNNENTHKNQSNIYFLISTETVPNFDWSYYDERIIKGVEWVLNTDKHSKIITYLDFKDSLRGILKQIGFKEEAVYGEDKRKYGIRMEI